MIPRHAKGDGQGAATIVVTIMKPARPFCFFVRHLAIASLNSLGLKTEEVDAN